MMGIETKAKAAEVIFQYSNIPSFPGTGLYKASKRRSPPPAFGMDAAGGAVIC